MLSNLPFHNAANYSVVFLPIIVYFSLRGVGLVFRPAAWVAERQAIIFSVFILIALASCSLFGIGWCILMLPVAAIWLLQVGLVQFALTLLASLWGTRNVIASEGTGERWLVGVSLFLMCSTFGAVALAQAYSISGKGSALDSFWMVGLLQDAISFDCQTGYSKIPLTVDIQAGRSVSGRNNPDWDLLGLQRYQISQQRGALHVSHWFTLLVSLAYPLLHWLCSNPKVSINFFATERSKSRNVR